MRYLYLLSAVIIFSLSVHAQTFENVRATAQGDRVIITYDLVSSQPDQAYTVEVYASHDNYQAPITKVIGDVGPNVKPGPSKTVAWNVADELKTFRGDITFELRGKFVVGKFSFRSPVVGAKVRRGKSATIEWQGGTPMQEVTITLYRGDRFVTNVAKTLNRGVFEWQIPKDMEKGDDYSFRLTTGSETVESQKFRVKPPARVLLKMAPLLGGLYFLIPPPTEEELPGPPGPS